MMIDLFNVAVRNLAGTWHDGYRDICSKVRDVKNWNDPDDASDELIKHLIYDSNNGVSYVGMAFLNWPLPRPSVGKYRKMLARLKDGFGKRYPGDEVLRCWEEFRRITDGKGSPSIFNRMVAAFQPGIVSPVMSENDFDNACYKLVKGGYVNPVRPMIGEYPWYSKNVQLMKQVRELLPDGHSETTVMPIDDYSRGMFVWGIHEQVNMDEWIILRNAR